MTDDNRRVADYFVIAGLPPPDKQKLLDQYSLEVNLKPSHNQDPITDITVIFPGLGENVPDYFQLIEATPTGLPADLNHGSFRAPEVFICFRRGRERPPLVDVGVLYSEKEKVMPDSQIVEFTPHGHLANVNNTTNSTTFLTYRRATDLSPCNELVVMDISIIVASKGEVPPHSFMKVDKNLNKAMMGSDVYLCYKKSMNRPDLVSYQPGLLQRFPVTNNPTFTLDDTVGAFCLPMGANLECWPTGTTRKSAVHTTFVLTLQNAKKVYGSAITFYEEYDEDKLDEEQKSVLKLQKYAKTTDRKVFTNKCICLLSQWPFFDAFGKFLFTLYKRQLMGPFDIPIERFISHFLYDVPFPSPERPRILVQMSAHDTIALFQPQELPLPRSGANFRHLLTTLGPDNCLLLLLLALTEQKILIHSLRPAILTAVVEAVMQIIFPFYWQCPYILPLPLVMSDYLSAPLPFVIGLDSRFFDLYDQPADVNAVDLDTNTISLCEERRSLSAKLLPKRLSRQLRSRLEQLTEKCIQYTSLAQKLEVENDEAIDFDFKLRAKEIALELEIQEAFLHFMAGILGGYRSFLLPITRAPTVGVTDVDNLFDRASFLRSRDRNYQKFYDLLLKTQMFTKFIEDCSFMSDVNTGLAFFDECVEKSLREEGSGRLLEVEGQTNDRTVFLLPPDASDLPQGAEYRYATFHNLNPALFKVPSEDGEDGGGQFMTPAISPPAGNMARRTKQEVRLAVRLATKHVDSPLLWAKCLLGTCYSVWFIHLPSMVLAKKGSIASLRQGYNLLERMRSLRLHPVEEICYRVMLQLCCAYNKPVLAVKILFEMKRCGVHPNAVTYGYYNKAVLESEWPHGIASSSQLLWHKLRNVLLAVWLFKQAGRAARARRRAQARLNEAETASQVSQTSLESGMSRQSGEPEDVDGGALERAPSGASKDSEVEGRVAGVTQAGDGGEGLFYIGNPQSSESGGSSGSHTSDVGYVSMNEIGVDKEGEKENGEGEEVEKEKLSRMRSFSIVKPKGPTEDENSEQIDETIVAPEEHHRTSVRQVWEEEKGESKSSSDKKPVKYTDIRNKFPHLLNKTDRTGPVRTLFRQESGDSQDQAKFGDSQDQAKFYMSESSGSSSRGGSELRSLSDDTSALEKSGSASCELDKSASVSCDSLEHMDSLPDSPVKRGREARLPTLEEVTPVEPETPLLGKAGLEADDTPQLLKADSRSNLMKTPVTQDDPLGALSSNNSPMVTPAKAATLPNGQRLNLRDVRSSSMSDVLGQPFATPDKLSTPSMDLSRHMQRSATMPLNGEILQEETQSPAGSTASLVGSISSLSGSAMKSLKASSAANVGMKRGKALLNTAWSSLSPNTANTKQTKEALNSSLASLKGWSNTAAINLSRRYETMRDSVQQSPARSLDPDAGDEVDRVSQCSTDSRRASESVLSDTVPDTWATLTEALWENLWGTQKSLNHLPQQTAQRAADITEQFESLYSRADSRRGDHPAAVLITMTTCTPCHTCRTPLYDEEIMAGWTAQDSNLNTKCVFCSRLTLPVLTVQVKDFRNSPRPSVPTPATSQQELREGGGGGGSNKSLNLVAGGSGSNKSLNLVANGVESPMVSPRVEREERVAPVTHPTITIPYISPIVLRKELESVLLKEGDECLTDPNCPDLHPHIFWNLIYNFHRIAVPSHLPGLVLNTPSLNKGLKPHDSWRSADHNNVVIKTKWDNLRIFGEDNTPLYLLWRKRNCQEEPTKMHPLMQSVIAGVKDNDLLQCVKSIVHDRQRKAEGRGSSTPSSSSGTPVQRMEDSEQRIVRSSYREALFLTLVSLGQDNIDLTAFDREYRRAFEKLPHKVVIQTEACDKPPGMQTLFCRKLFRDLQV